MTKSIIYAVIVITLYGCATGPADRTEEWSAEQLYNAGKEELDRRRYDSAIGFYEKLERRFPYGSYAQQAALDSSYAHWKFNDPEQAIAACDRFIRDYPKHENIAYAYYLKGFINLKESSGVLSFLGADMSEKDPTPLKEAFNSFSELITLYPESKYSADAAAKMRLIKNTLARHEVHIAEYSLKRGYFVAAVGRASEVLENYPDTPAIEGALVVLVKSYENMGLTELHDDARLLLITNFPENMLVTEKKPEREWKLW